MGLGHSMIPDQLLAPQALVGLGLGQAPNTGVSENGSPIWITPACADPISAPGFS